MNKATNFRTILDSAKAIASFPDNNPFLQVDNYCSWCSITFDKVFRKHFSLAPGPSCSVPLVPCFWAPLQPSSLHHFECHCGRCSVTKSCPTLCDPMDCSAPGFPVLHYLPEFAQIYVQRCYLTISSSATLFFAFFPSRVFSNRLTLHIRWPEYWSFSISPSNEYSGLIFFRLEWFNLLATQGTLKSLPSSTIRRHQFFGTQPPLWSNSQIRTWLLKKP